MLLCCFQELRTKFLSWPTRSYRSQPLPTSLFHIAPHSHALFNSNFSSLNMPHAIWPQGVFHTCCYLCLDTFPSPLLNLSFFQNFLYSPLKGPPSSPCYMLWSDYIPFFLRTYFCNYALFGAFISLISFFLTKLWAPGLLCMAVPVVLCIKITSEGPYSTPES